ncbi:hypothetical protein [Microbacterium murale]|uniref:DUF5658 domain-containing protein n=1 Tax=Microbacterium murale TaxID=1081040 RepID=A0ABU0PD03_9MICO|nr:hypothetical protein [Microbacterium murale]MDQ0645212.1 hypothetical protein [Microbacterium murale]
MSPWEIMLAVTETPKAPNLWGALGCAMAYAAALLAALDAFADMLLARAGVASAFGPAHGLKFGGKLVAAGVTVVSAGMVLALDSNWFAFTALSVVFVVVVSSAVLIMRRTSKGPRVQVENAPQ